MGRLADAILKSYKQGLEARNDFVHPQPWEKPVFPQVESEKSYPDSLANKWLDEVAEALEHILDILIQRVDEISWRVLVSNRQDLSRHLSEKQRAVFRGFFRESGQMYSGLTTLLEAIDRAKNEGDKCPEGIVLDLTGEVYRGLGSIKEFAGRHSEIPIMLCEAFSTEVGRKERKEIDDFCRANAQFAWIPDHRYSKDKDGKERYDDKYDRDRELQRVIKKLVGV